MMTIEALGNGFYFVRAASGLTGLYNENGSYRSGDVRNASGAVKAYIRSRSK